MNEGGERAGDAEGEEEWEWEFEAYSVVRIINILSSEGFWMCNQKWIRTEQQSD